MSHDLLLKGGNPRGEIQNDSVSESRLIWIMTAGDCDYFTRNFGKDTEEKSKDVVTQWELMTNHPAQGGVHWGGGGGGDYPARRRCSGTPQTTPV